MKEGATAPRAGGRGGPGGRAPPVSDCRQKKRRGCAGPVWAGLRACAQRSGEKGRRPGVVRGLRREGEGGVPVGPKEKRGDDEMTEGFSFFLNSFQIHF
jgi:hypothetical protein